MVERRSLVDSEIRIDSGFPRVGPADLGADRGAGRGGGGGGAPVRGVRERMCGGDAAQGSSPRRSASRTASRVGARVFLARTSVYEARSGAVSRRVRVGVCVLRHALVYGQ